MKHASLEPTISPDRLFAAADAILGGIHSPRGFSSRISMHVGPVRAGRCLPASVFTSDELIEGMAMLIRMGLLPSDPSPRIPAARDTTDRTLKRPPSGHSSQELSS